jgi:Cu(I)/Ag(I) efflux system membrane protein CusA/SilA
VEEHRARGALNTPADLVEAIVHGAVKRVRPKAMTVLAAMLGLLPIMWSTGTGADLMKRIAAPMVGGLVTSFALELLVYPAVYLLWLRRTMSGAGGVLAGGRGETGVATPKSGREDRGGID